jgi:serine/threonine protein kinase
MEYCAGGDIAALIKKAAAKGKSFSEEKIWRILMQIILALNECHND